MSKLPPAPNNSAIPNSSIPEKRISKPIGITKAVAGKVVPKILINAVEGFGKTSCGAFAPNACMVMSRDETGYQTLLDAGRVPSIFSIHVKDWTSAFGAIDAIASSEIETVVFDALDGFERLCHEHVCCRDFRGDWTEKGFLSFGKGAEVSVSEWLLFLNAITKLTELGKIVLLLSHCKIKTFKNPLGEDYDRYSSTVHDKTWAVTARWSDAVLFGTFYSVVQSEKGKRPKGIGGAERIIYTERRDAFDAKNRYGLPEVIDIPNDPSKIWSTIMQHIKGAKT